MGADANRLDTIFKDIHQNPELGFAETRTAGIVARELRALGFDVKTGIGKTGVVGVLKNGSGPTVMYRADMDANAVEEGTDLPYASKVRVKREDGSESPVAHMCGHDAHVTWMLGMAKAMVAMKGDWSGTMVLVGQPAEEPILGAQAMVDDGLCTKYGIPRPDFFIGMHTAPGPVGVVVSSGGPKMAGSAAPRDDRALDSTKPSDHGAFQWPRTRPSTPAPASKTTSPPEPTSSSAPTART